MASGKEIELVDVLTPEKRTPPRPVDEALQLHITREDATATVLGTTAPRYSVLQRAIPMDVHEYSVLLCSVPAPRTASGRRKAWNASQVGGAANGGSRPAKSVSDLFVRLKFPALSLPSPWPLPTLAGRGDLSQCCACHHLGERAARTVQHALCHPPQTH